MRSPAKCMGYVGEARSRLNTLHFPSDDFLHPTHAGNGVGGMIIICPDMYL